MVIELQTSKDTVLQLSYISYQTAEITINDSQFIQNSLVSEVQSLGEVVIVSSVSKMRAGMEKTTYELKSNTTTVGGTGLDVLRISFGNLEVGYQYKRLVHKGDFLYEIQNNQTGIFELVPEFSNEVNLFRDSHSIYTQLSKNYEKWEYNIGVRAETLNRDFELKDKANTINETLNYRFNKLFPSGALMYYFKNKNELRLGYSKRVEHTTTFKMNPFPEKEH